MKQLLFSSGEYIRANQLTKQMSKLAIQASSTFIINDEGHEIPVDDDVRHYLDDSFQSLKGELIHLLHQECNKDLDSDLAFALDRFEQFSEIASEFGADQAYYETSSVGSELLKLDTAKI